MASYAESNPQTSNLSLPELFISLLRFRSHPSIRTSLIERMNIFPEKELLEFSHELIKLSSTNFPELKELLLQIVKSSFRIFAAIYLEINSWRHTSPSLHNLYTSLEVDYVNGDSNLQGTKEECFDAHMKKYSRNIQKDNMLSLMMMIEQLGLLLQITSRDRLSETVLMGLKKIDEEVFLMSRVEGWTGVSLPFLTLPSSSSVVRISTEEFKIFPTKTHVVLLIFLETVSESDVKYFSPNNTNNLQSIKFEFEQLKTARVHPSSIEMKVPAFRRRMTDWGFDFKTQKQTFKPKKIFDFRSKTTPVQKKSKGNLSMVNKLSGLLLESEILRKVTFISSLIQRTKDSRFISLSRTYIDALHRELEIQKASKRLSKKSKNDRQNSLQELKNSCRKKSPFGHFPSHVVRPFVLKSGDDMRQESYMLHLIRYMNSLFRTHNASLKLIDVDFILISSECCLIEFIGDTLSVDRLKKNHPNKSLREIYREKFRDNFEVAQKNFITSLAGYSYICYLFNITDRHNANILVDSHGHFIHIDFGFCFNHAPGNISFERAPFKLTQEYINLMGGKDSALFEYFKVLIFQGLTIGRKCAEEIKAVIEISSDCDLPCFRDFILGTFVSRLYKGVSDERLAEIASELVEESLGASSTALYDRFQKLTNDIEI